MRSGDEPIGQDERSFIEVTRRSQIVACAIDAIAELSYPRASLAEIAKRARVSKSLLLYHFADKDELVDEVVKTVYEAGTLFLRTRLREDLPPRQWLRDYIRLCVEFVGMRRTGLVALGEIFVNRRTQKAGPELPDATGDPERHVARQLRRGQQEGAFRAFAVPTMARAIRAVLDDVASSYSADPGIELDRWAEELVTLFDVATRAH